MSGTLYSVQKTGAAPTLAEAARQLGVAVSSLDKDFGVQPINPRAGEYAVLLLPEVPPPDVPADRGPYANPRIDTFGPPSR